MIISKTPYRISFFGGGTDFPSWYNEHGGAVVSTTIDKYCYISCRQLPPFFPHKFRFVYSIIEDVRTISDIKHPAIKAIFEWLEINQGLEVHHDGDLPARSGLGSSSSFTVGLLNVLRAYDNRYYSKKDLASDAIFVEQELIKETVGSQDQVAVSFGGFNHITFSANSQFDARPIMLDQAVEKKLNDNLLLFFTGIQRYASSIEAEKQNNRSSNLQTLTVISDMVDEAMNLLTSKKPKLREFGSLLDDSWKLKRSLSKNVSNKKIDEAYDAAKSCGALGGKILGAGGGGFMLFYAPKQIHHAIISRLKPFVHVPFRFEKTGSSIALYQPSGL